ncbi:aminotransferase class I/II-fold pyridoxal phosphate-dependent enzyme [Gudongella sp. SC589]|uniref:aminotransferase class I/II-fold pyridoxal phosphate-dependent enzyme n=1 Tax=Gudongella sp. SC589 TaxID=3385990 RepID=UPI00390491C8
MDKRYIAKRYQGREKSQLAASADQAAEMDDLINFTIGDPDVITDERIIEGAFNDAKRGYTRYTESVGMKELREEISKYFHEEYNHKVGLDEVMVTTSACQGMWLVLESLLDEGDEVIIPSPYFPPYSDQVKLAGGVPVYMTLKEEEDYQLDVGKLERLITERTKALIINTPNNPIGSCLSRDTLVRIGEVAKKHDILIIADDIYTIYSYQAPFVPTMTLPGLSERTITLGSFSKDYAMTGWRIGYIIAKPDFIQVMKAVNENNVYSAPSISQRAAIHALRLRSEIQPGLVEEFRKRTFYAYERLNRLKGVHVMEPKGTFYLFPNIRGTGLSSAQVAEKLLKEAHVAVVPGNAFGPGGEGYLRLAVTLGVDRMKEAFDRMEGMDIFK